MSRRYTAGTMLAALSLAFSPAYGGWPGDPAKCKPDAVKAGSVCMDKYEASVWQVPATNPAGKSNKGLITKIQNGTVKLADLSGGGAIQISPSPSSSGDCTLAFPATFPTNGQWTVPLYAVSIAGVHPTACVTWFQAQQACANSRKRLPSNAEWQMAAAGTPEGAAGNDGLTQCNTSAAGDASAPGFAVNTGSRSACVSNYGAFDMVGNVAEWVAEWVPRSNGGCGGSQMWTGSLDWQCLLGAATTGEPGALQRGGDSSGGDYGGGPHAGPFSVFGFDSPSDSFDSTGFRCAR